MNKKSKITDTIITQQKPVQRKKQNRYKTKEGSKPPIQTKESNKPAITTKEGRLGPIRKADNTPIQRAQVAQENTKGFDAKDKTTIDQLVTDINTKLTDINTSITELNNRKKLNKKKRAQLKDLQQRKTELKKALTEIKAMKDSTKLTFKLEVGDKPMLTLDETDKNTVIIKYDGTSGSLINELTHGYQYLTGKVDFVQLSDGKTSWMAPGLLYDIHDELATYQRQYAFDGQLKLQTSVTASEYQTALMNGKTKGLGQVEVDNMDEITPELLNKVSDAPLGSSLYSNIAQTPLDKSSKTSDVIKANGNRSALANGLKISETSNYGTDVQNSPNRKFIFLQ
jgi:hypothetical protein